MSASKPKPTPTKIHTVTETVKPKAEAISTPLLFEKANYQIMILGLVVIALGFVLMAGGASENPNEFHPEEVFSFRRITLAPAVVMLGFALEVVAIFYKKKSA